MGVGGIFIVANWRWGGARGGKEGCVCEVQMTRKTEEKGVCLNENCELAFPP